MYLLELVEMSKLSNPYLISFAGLKNAEHAYRYVIDDTFFKDREYSEIQKARIDTQVVLKKETNLLVFEIKMEGTINVLCDRCGDYFDMPVWGENKLIVSLTHNRFEEESDIIALSMESSEIDISQYLYEYVAMLLPQRRIHPDKGDGSSACNPEALKLLQQLETQKKEEDINPIWAELKGKIKNN
jgi:uncharacterized metal-binding protein YceD (DUF177 family)